MHSLRTIAQKCATVTAQPRFTSMRALENFASFEFVLRAAVRATDGSRVGNIQKHAWMPVPKLHARLGAWAENPAVMVKLFCQKLDTRLFLRIFRACHSHSINRGNNWMRLMPRTFVMAAKLFYW